MGILVGASRFPLQYCRVTSVAYVWAQLHKDRFIADDLNFHKDSMQVQYSIIASLLLFFLQIQKRNNQLNLQKK